MKELLKRNKKAILNGCLTLVSFVVISLACLLLLMAFDVVYYDEGVQFNAELFLSFTNSWYGWLIFIVVQIICTTLLCFIPGTSMTFIMLAQTMYPNPWHAFLLSFVAVMLSSMIMYLTGRFGGYKLSAKILGKEDCEKASHLLNDKGIVFFPIMMLFPMFPDDALIMIAGTLKMSLKWFIPSIIIGRGIGIATIIFGLSFVPFEHFTEVWHWVVFILICAVLVAAVFLLAYKFNQFLHKQNEKKARKHTESPQADAPKESSENNGASDKPDEKDAEPK